MPLPEQLARQLRIPVIGAPMFIVSGPDLVLAQCKSGKVKLCVLARLEPGKGEPHQSSFVGIAGGIPVIQVDGRIQANEIRLFSQPRNRGILEPV